MKREYLYSILIILSFVIYILYENSVSHFVFTRRQSYDAMTYNPYLNEEMNETMNSKFRKFPKQTMKPSYGPSSSYIQPLYSPY